VYSTPDKKHAKVCVR